MTPRTKESLNQIFSELILMQAKDPPGTLDLRADGPLLDLLPPKVIKAMLEFILDPLRSPKVEFSGLNVACYGSCNEATLLNPKVKFETGRPHAVFNYLNGQQDEILLNFSPLGVVRLSKNGSRKEEKNGLVDQVLLPFLNYALGPELWGPSGKWTRFHERLQLQFEKYGLLAVPAQPGRYSLDRRAQGPLERNGIIGTLENEHYMLIMPWTFSLSSLQYLFSVLEREF